jgi:phosphotransferase system HPr-like phosphotransfer protein
MQKDAEQVDAKQVIDILTLAAAKGDTVRIRIETTADLETLMNMVQMVDSGFGE